MTYIGRFAPSPSGPLHLGSLLTAVASYLDAHANQGQWLLRIEDIDPPREQAGASEVIIQSLAAHHLHWDGEVIWQSKRHDYYDQQLDVLIQNNDLFACTCTRKTLKAFPTYPGTCRNKNANDCMQKKPQDAPFALRINTKNSLIYKLNDTLQGAQQFDLSKHGGDFILRRKDGLYAYHLAVCVDDKLNNISHIVRGVDLLEHTGQHLFLQQKIGSQAIHYMHIPVLATDDGNKLSKQFGAPAIDTNTPEKNLRVILNYLKQAPPPESHHHCSEILQWAIKHWQPQRLINQKIIYL